MAKEIPLTRGFTALVDDQDFEYLTSVSSWCCTEMGRKRARYNVAQGHVNGRNILMHRLIMDAGPGEYVDHKNHNTLDNRRSNLRLCTNSQNQANKPINPTRGRSQFRGVHFDKTTRNCWRACIMVNRKLISLGNYADEAEAARAYDTGAIRYFGEFAQLNFPNKALQS